jgi:hypothetical protein
VRPRQRIKRRYKIGTKDAKIIAAVAVDWLREHAVTAAR